MQDNTQIESLEMSNIYEYFILLLYYNPFVLRKRAFNTIRRTRIKLEIHYYHHQRCVDVLIWSKLDLYFALCGIHPLYHQQLHIFAFLLL